MHEVKAVRVESRYHGVGYAVILDDEVQHTCFGPNAERIANDDVEKMRANLKARSPLND